jgi:isopenicillin N synthase-like dioxygenase
LNTFLESGYLLIPKSARGNSLSAASLDLAIKLFNLPETQKESCANVSNVPYANGWRVAENGAEFWHLSSKRPIDNFPPALSKYLHTLDELMLEVAKCVIPSVLASLEAVPSIDGEKLKSALGHTATRARIIWYKPSQHNRFAAHFDSGLITVFSAQSSPSLEYIIDRRWINYLPDDYWLVGCAQGLSKAAGTPALEHRVVGDNLNRYACALFFHDQLGLMNTGKLRGA